MKKTIIIPIATVLLLSACSQANQTPATNSTESALYETQAPENNEVAVTLDIQFPNLSADATDFTVTFTPKEGNDEPIAITVSPKDLTYEKPTVNMKRIKYDIAVTSPENPDGTTYDTSATDADVDIEFLESVTETPTILITGTRETKK